MIGIKNGDGKGLRVLIADDVPLNLRILSTMLQKLGHTGVMVADGEQALRALEQQPFDLVLLDSSMPVLDGFGTLRAIRAKGEQGHPHLPVIFVSGHASEEDKRRFLAAGADGVVFKPVMVDDLRSQIARVMGA